MKAEFELYNRVQVTCPHEADLRQNDPHAIILKFIGSFGYVVQCIPPKKFDDRHTYRVHLDEVKDPVLFWEDELVLTG